MKYAVLAVIAFLATIALAPEAEAVVCARGYRGAGCASARGAVVVRRPPVARCYYSNGRRICRY